VYSYDSPGIFERESTRFVTYSERVGPLLLSRCVFMGVVLSVGSPVKSHNKKIIPITRRSECVVEHVEFLKKGSCPTLSSPRKTRHGKTTMAIIVVAVCASSQFKEDQSPCANILFSERTHRQRIYSGVCVVF
jgi:hypothetical protein